MKLNQLRDSDETNTVRFKSGSIHDLTWTVICIFPFLILIYLVASYGVNVPYMDQWELTSLFEKVAKGNLSFQDLFAQHNEHRLFFPRFIFIALAFLTHWNTKYEMYFSILLIVVSYVLIQKIFSRQVFRKDTEFWLISLSISIIITSFVQEQNLLWGFQVAWFFISFCLILAIFLLTSRLRSIWLKILLGGTVCIIASFSSAHGLMTWLAVTPCILTLAHESNKIKTRSVIKIVLCWSILFVLSCSIYFHNYQKPPSHPDTLFFVKHLDVSLNYFFSLLGTPLFSASDLSWLPGLVITANFFWFFIRYVQNPYSEFSQQASPWLSMGSFAFLFTLITAVGRSGFGATQAYSSRYTSITILLIIALIQLWRLKSFKLSNYRWQYLAVTSIFTVLVSISSINKISVAQEGRLDRGSSRSCLEITASVDSGMDSCLQRLFPDPKLLRKRTKMLNQIGIRQDPESLNFLTAQNNSYGFIDSPQASEQALSIKKTCLNCAQEITVAGWAILPNELKPASLVLISHNPDKSEAETILESASVRLPSPDVAEALQSKRYAQARWSLAVPIKQLPLGETALKAWVYDGKGRQFIKLGEIKVQVEK
ncbi:MAG: hypothetical protein RLZZ381_1262 [Cyanobacteriota bacterium]|jgi:hypothetical protein